MRLVLLLTLLTLAACAEKDGDVICRRTMLSHPYTYSDGVERKSDVFECAQSNGAACVYVETASGANSETNCTGDVLLSR